VISLLGLRRALDRRMRLGGGDFGFSLIESVIALVIAGGVFSSLSVVLLQTVQASSQSRQNQNAVDILNKQVEFVRSLDFSAATEITSDLSGDANLTYTSGTYYLNTSAGLEPVVAGTVGLIPQHVKTILWQGTTYGVSTYVTQVTDPTNASANYRRVTVIVTWTVNGRSHTKRTSSFFTDTRRGLPLPRFTMGTAGSYRTNVGATLALPIKITNVGAPDAFNLTGTTPGGGSWTWYADTNNDNTYTAADTALTDTDGNGSMDTGLLQVGSSIVVFAVRTVAVGEPTTQTVTFTATSAAQPTATTASQGFSDQLLVDPASCTCTLSTFLLHNGATYGDTVYQSTSGSNTPMSMNKTPIAITRTNLYNYSTDCFSILAASDCNTVTAGRYVRTGGTQTESDKTKVAAWYYPVAGQTCLKGSASITIWVRTADGLASASTLTAYIGRDSNNGLNGTFVIAGSGAVTYPASSVAGWQPVTVGVPINTNLDTSGSTVGKFSVANNKYLAVRIVASGALNIRLGYDTTSYNAQAVLPIVPC
jgi:type II secretory pathway pseudopilin PulG